MALEGYRKLLRKRLIDPDDPNPDNPTNYVDVPVIDAIFFRDRKGSFAECIAFVFDSYGFVERIMHTKKVKNAIVENGVIKYDDDNLIEVERPDGIVVRDRRASYAETKGYKFLNNDPPPRTAEDSIKFPDGVNPDHRHYQSRVFRYTKPKDDGTPDPNGVPWVDVEVIDGIQFRDHKEYAQGQVLILGNDPPIDQGKKIKDLTGDSSDPFDPLFAICDPTLTLVKKESKDIDPPWRIDPFQNIVNVNWGSKRLIILAGARLSAYSGAVIDESGALKVNLPMNGSTTAFDQILPNVGECACSDKDKNVFLGLVNVVGDDDATGALIKYSPTGVILWQALTSAAEGIATVASVGCDNNGNVYLSYNSSTTTGALYKFSPAGSEIWRKTYEVPALDVCVLPSGIVLVRLQDGTLSAYRPNGDDLYSVGGCGGLSKGGSETIAAKLDDGFTTVTKFNPSTGIEYWSATAGDGGGEFPFAVDTASDGTIYVNGESGSDFWIKKFANTNEGGTSGAQVYRTVILTTDDGGIQGSVIASGKIAGSCCLRNIDLGEEGIQKIRDFRAIDQSTGASAFTFLWSTTTSELGYNLADCGR